MSRLSNGAALFYEMGLGKTKTIIDTVQILHQHGYVSKVVVIAPLPLLNTWENEIEIHGHDKQNVYQMLDGGKQKKLKKLDMLLHPVFKSRISWAIINPDGLANMSRELAEYKFDMVVVDESTMMKNRTTVRTKTIISLFGNATYKVIMSGNPIPKRPAEIFSQYRFIEPAVFSDRFFEFQEIFFKKDYFGNATGFKNEKMQAEFEKRLHSKGIVRRKKDCIDLPPKIYETIQVQMSESQQKVYDTMKKEALISYEDKTCSAAVVLTKMLRLSQIAGGIIPSDDGKPILFKEQPKLEALLTVLEEIGEDKPVVVWARFQMEIEMIEARLQKEGIKCVTFYGKDSFKERIEARQQFREGEVRVFIGNPQCGGKGLNDLVGSNTVIYYSNDYSAENRIQAEDRTHRQGTLGESVLYIDLVAAGTIDSQVLSVLRNNRDFSDSILERQLVI